MLPDRPGIEITSELWNPSANKVSGVVLRAHAQFSLGAGKPGLSLRVRDAAGQWVKRPWQGESWLTGDQLPVGAWGVGRGDGAPALVNEFDPSQVSKCFLYISPANDSYNPELFSQKRDLAPGEALRLTHRYVLTREG